MASFPLVNIVENSVFTEDVTLGKNFLLSCAHMPFTPALKKALADWDFREVFSEGETQAQKVKVIPTKKEEKQPAAQQAPVAVKTSDFEEVKLEDLDAVEEVQERNLAAETRSAIEKIKASAQESEKSRMETLREIYNEYTLYILNVYTHYATHRKIKLSDISAISSDLCAFIRENKRYVLRITPNIKDNEKNFLISHSMRSTVLAIAIGLQLRMPLDKLIELGIASILHEIGQIRLPPQLYMTDRTLTPTEKAQMRTHPILSFNILKENAFPLAISLATLEHHERANGSGYPRKLMGSKISVYAKIIGVACSFEAITAPRLHKEEKTTFAAMVEILRNTEHKYDETVVKALLYCLSLYPIGAYVYLSNGKIGQVTDVTPEQPMHPIVQLMSEKDENGKPITVQTDNAQNKIARVLNKQEAEDLFITMQLEAE